MNLAMIPSGTFIVTSYCSGRPKPQEFPRHPDVIVDLHGFPGDKSPNINLFFAKVSDVLTAAGIKWCLAGDQAWEYYNAPFVISVNKFFIYLYISLAN